MTTQRRRMCLYLGNAHLSVPDGCSASFGEKRGVRKFLVHSKVVDGKGNGRVLSLVPDEWPNFIFDGAKDIQLVTAIDPVPEHFHTLELPEWLFSFELPMPSDSHVVVSCSYGEGGCCSKLPVATVSPREKLLELLDR